MEHKMKREHGGEGMMGWMQPACSCGWKGTQFFAYEDYQHTSCARQEVNHKREADAPSPKGQP